MISTKKKVIAGLIALTIIVIIGGVSTHITKASNFEVEKNVNWSKIGSGNLQAEEVEGQWSLHSSPAVYLNMLGIQNKEIVVAVPIRLYDILT